MIFIGTGGNSMKSGSPSLSEWISGILMFAARPGERIPFRRIHSILSEMQSHDSLVSGIDFLIEGKACYSREVERVLQDLLSKGILGLEDDSTVLVENACSVCIRLSVDLSYTDCKMLRSASSIFYERLRGMEKPAPSRALGNVA
jgi:hypothetical protein